MTDKSSSYVRLFLRKTSAWHRINSLGYHQDIADLSKAIEILQQNRELPESTHIEAVHPGEMEPTETTSLGASFTFADKSETEITTLDEASSLLRLDELKSIAKDARITGKNKRDLLVSLRKSSRKQTGLGYFGLKRSDTTGSTKSTGEEEEDEASSSTGTPDIQDMDESSRDAHFTKKILSETGPCIRLSLDTLKLFERVHLVFYRSSEWTEKSLTTIILSKISRRNFPEYLVSRSANVFASRALLLEYEASLRTQSQVDNILEFNGPPSQVDLKRIIETHEAIHQRWRNLLAEEQEKEDSVYLSGEGAYLRRLSPAWVYTRIAHKAAGVLGKFKEHKREHELLSELLSQRLFHHSRRGAWYQRKALLEEHYMAALMPSEGRNDESQRRYWKRVSLETCEDGLEDPLVHIIYHHDLQKRVMKLEKSLKIAKRFQHDFAHVRLTAPIEVTFEGIRIEKEPSSTSARRISSPHPTSAAAGGTNTNRRGAKTNWLDPLEGDGQGECSVEAMCLSNYRMQGWKGYHSEGGIVRTLFGYLLFDIMFTYIPNVFQTQYQTCPLDLHTDGFYPSRLSEINQRLLQISNGQAETLLKDVWTQHFERKTCIVGLDWSFELEDLIEIVQCFPAEALATICRVMAQEYAQRGGGLPDLFLWRTDTREVKFSEVKSENDRLSDTQRLWIHVLTSAGVKVELCHAVAKEVRVR